MDRKNSAKGKKNENTPEKTGNVQSEDPNTKRLKVSHSKIQEEPKIKARKNKKDHKDKKVYQPHDTFFKSSMSRPEMITSFLHSYLPAEIGAVIDYSSLIQIEPKSISPKLKMREADLLYRAQIGGRNAYLLLLMEHKSYQDRHTPLQLLRYMVEIWDQELLAQQKLSPVLPIVFYQGAQKWEYLQLKDYFMTVPKELWLYLPIYQALYYDFSLENQAVIKGVHLELNLYLRLIQAIYLPGQERFIQEAIEIFRAFSQTDPEIRFDYMERSIAYISAVREDLTDQNIVDIVTQEGGGSMETIIDRLEKRGEKRGELRGIAIGKQEGISIGELRGITIGKQEGITIGEHREKLAFAVKMKRDGFAIEKIMEYTGLSREEIMDL